VLISAYLQGRITSNQTFHPCFTSSVLTISNVCKHFNQGSIQMQQPRIKTQQVKQQPRAKLSCSASAASYHYCFTKVRHVRLPRPTFIPLRQAELQQQAAVNRDSGRVASFQCHPLFALRVAAVHTDSALTPSRTTDETCRIMVLRLYRPNGTPKTSVALNCSTRYYI
jgi:hypothetical protein